MKYRLLKSDLYKSGIKFHHTNVKGDKPYKLAHHYIKFSYPNLDIRIEPFEHNLAEFVIIYKVTVNGEFPYHFYLAVMEIVSDELL